MHNQPLRRIEVHGKNLFYFFGDDTSPQVVHIHFGMSGAFKTMALPGPEPTETTRLKLVNEEHGIVAQLSAMTVILGDMGECRLDAGPCDPLYLQWHHNNQVSCGNAWRSRPACMHAPELHEVDLDVCSAYTHLLCECIMLSRARWCPLRHLSPLSACW